MQSWGEISKEWGQLCGRLYRPRSGAWWGQEVGIRKAEAAGECVVVEQVGEVGGDLVIEGFASEEKDFKVDPLLAYDIFVRKPDFFA